MPTKGVPTTLFIKTTPATSGPSRHRSRRRTQLENVIAILWRSDTLQPRQEDDDTTCDSIVKKYSGITEISQRVRRSLYTCPWFLFFFFNESITKPERFQTDNIYCTYVIRKNYTPYDTDKALLHLLWDYDNSTCGYGKNIVVPRQTVFHISFILLVIRSDDSEFELYFWVVKLSFYFKISSKLSLNNFLIYRLFQRVRHSKNMIIRRPSSTHLISVSE